MATAIIVIILILIGLYTIKSYTKKLKGGCCGGGIDEENLPIKPHDRNKSHYQYSYSIIIKGMSCQNCQMRVENAFNKLDGYYMQVNLQENKGILLTKQEISKEKIQEIIKDAGYKAIDVKQLKSA